MRLDLVLTALYLALAVYIWLDFMRAPQDGPANVGLFLVTFPGTVVGLPSRG
jgi:hypothetical protein